MHFKFPFLLVCSSQNDLNVIIVDWKEAAKMPNYMQAVANTRSVGAMIARLIFDLYTYKWASLEVRNQCKTLEKFPIGTPRVINPIQL